MTDAASSLFLLVQIFFVDLLLGADNAIVIAMACGRLAPADARRATVLGAGGAIALRMVMLVFANALLGVPLVKLVGAWTLIVIALNVRAHHDEQGAGEAGRASGPRDFVSAATLIMVADATMSLDNVVALAAIAGGNLWLLAIGVLVSIPVIVYGAFILTRIVRRAPAIVTIGAALLGWIAGGMAIGDPLVSGWIAANAPALGAIAPALGALFVLAAVKGAPQPAERRTPGAELPAPRLKTAPATPAEPQPPRTPPGLAVPCEPLASVALSAAPRPAAEAEAQPSAAAAPSDEAGPGFAPDAPTADAPGGWSEDRLVAAGFVLLAVLAGLIIFIASFFDSLT